MPPPPAAAASGKQAEPLELDPLGGSVAPPRDPARTDDVDSAFERLVSQAPQPASPGVLVDDEHAKKANAELFRNMAPSHAKPIRDFMLELSVGPASKQWVDVARPALESLLRGARELAEKDLVDALVSFSDTVGRAAMAVGSRIEGAMRDELVRAYAVLSTALPQAFDLTKERDRREPVVVRHLLLQIPGVHKVAIDKLYSAGLASLDALCRSSVDDLMHVARLERDGADAISTRFRAYWSERASQSVTKAEELARRRLSALLEQLAVSHQEFQRAEADEDRDRKRTARHARRASSLSINVLLAQLGEVDLVEELERSPTERKIERIRTFVDRMARQRTQELEEAV